MDQPRKPLRMRNVEETACHNSLSNGIEPEETLALVPSDEVGRTFVRHVLQDEDVRTKSNDPVGLRCGAAT